MRCPSPISRVCDGRERGPAVCVDRPVIRLFLIVLALALPALAFPTRTVAQNADDKSAAHLGLHVYPFADGGRVGLMDQHGRIVADPVFDAAGRASGGMIPLRSGVRWGLWSAADSSWAIEAAHADLAIVADSIVSVRTPDGWTLMSFSGRRLVPGSFHELRAPSEDVFAAAVVEDQGPVDERVRWGIFSLDGDTLVTPAFENLLSFGEGVAPARVNRRLLRFIKRSPRWGFVAPDGTWSIEPEFDSARSFSDGLALVSADGALFFVDTAGDARITVRHDLAYSFAEGRARVVSQGLWGWIDTGGRVAIEPAWEGALDFSEGLAAVRRAGRWGYVDREGRVAIPARFDAAAPFRGPLAEVVLDGRRFRIDRSGREVAPRPTH